MTCDSTCCQNVPALTGNEMYKLWQSIIYILSGCYDCNNGFDDYKLVLIGFIAGFFILLFGGINEKILFRLSQLSSLSASADLP
jgi:hypothetical protein